MEIGIYCSSIRPHLWVDLYKTLSTNNANFNLCISGPYPPISTLPGNVKYIQTNVKPPQCNFIAANNTEGDYIFNVPDDITLNPGCLDNLLKTVRSEKNVITTPKYKGRESQYQLVTELACTRADNTAQFIPINFPIPVCTLMRRKDFDSIGIDKSFLATFWDQDMSFEFVSRGGKCILSENSFIKDIQGPETSTLGILALNNEDYFWRFVDMWTDNRKTLRTKRKVPIDPLVYNDTVLTVSQGPKTLTVSRGIPLPRWD